MALVDIIKKVFGTKSDRDMKQVKPILDKVTCSLKRSIDKLSSADELTGQVAEEYEERK